MFGVGPDATLARAIPALGGSVIVLSAMLFSATECVCVLMSAVAALSATYLHTAHSPPLRVELNYLGGH